MGKRYVILVVVLVILIFISQGTVKWLAKVKYERQRDLEVAVTLCEMGQSMEISGCEVTITEAEWTDEDQQMLKIRYAVEGSENMIQQLSLCTLCYVKMDGEYIPEAVRELKGETEYCASMDKEQGDLVFVLPENTETVSFYIYEYADIVETLQVQGNMLVYKPYTAPALSHIYEMVIRG